MPYFIFTLLLTSVYKLRGGSLSQLGLCWPDYPDKSKRQIITIIVLLALSIFALRIFFAVTDDLITHLFPKNTPRENPLLNNLALLIGLLPLMWLVVIGEEVLFRGLLMNYLVTLFGNNIKAWIIAIIVSAIIFGLGHMGKGPGAAIGSGLGGLAYGIGYYYSRKNLWPVIVAHCAVNTIGFVGAYFG
jgi:membrane protease YdiL (CAAX protease family)